MKCDDRCGRDAVYRQNKYTVLCITCWYETSKNIFDIWFEDKTKPMPWIFNRDRIIKGNN
ncbi:hypothetical protein LCGC14_1337900 [marine sediment metagenome]|uniref:Uncharacterized protein n=1 Tax=marine sediment metagenome TaxID=412755 RepID=A0A0F9MVG2_9ZZZZ